MKPLWFSVQLSQYGATIRRLCIWVHSSYWNAPFTFLFSCQADHDCFDKLSQVAGVYCILKEVKPKYSKRSFVIRFATTYALFKELWSGKYNIVFSMLLLSEIVAFFVVKIVNFLRGYSIKYVVFRGGPPILPDYLSSTRIYFYKLIIRFIYARSDKIITICNALKDLLVEEYGARAERIEVIPISVDYQGSKQQEIHSKNTSDTFTFGILARLSSEKSLDHALHATARLHKAGINFRLEIFGTGDQLDALQVLTSQLGLKEIVHFHGWITDPYVAISMIDCLVLPSRYEGTPRSILEAGCHGVPTIASSVGGVPDLIEHGKTGWLYKYGDIDRLTDLMKEAALSQSICFEIGRNFQMHIFKNRTESTEIQSVSQSLQGVIS